MNLLKKAGAILMVCIMLVTLFPASAFADAYSIKIRRVQGRRRTS